MPCQLTDEGIKACSGQQGTTVEAEHRPVLGGGGCQPAVQDSYRAEDGVCVTGEHCCGSVPEQVVLETLMAMWKPPVLLCMSLCSRAIGARCSIGTQRTPS